MNSFGPVINSDTRILIVGTFPGVKSIEKKQYYGHPYNRLWDLVYDVFAGTTPHPDYADRLAFLLAHNTGLWDIIKSCRREGSLDQAIRGEEPNDFASLLQEYPAVCRLLFNGQKAWHWFKKYQRTRVHERTGVLPECLVMPSTSPAHAISYCRKKEEWKRGLSGF
ncbi:MAG: DNA-deoxyinosine glycosylase [Spirochaetales bacterium]|nr:DNA-deoxyinosine glycosylase [Spirochaetales bacterium]